MDQIKLKSITRGLRKVADEIESSSPLDAINYAWPLAIRAEGYLQSAAAESIPSLAELLAPVDRRSLTGLDRVTLSAAPLFWSIVGTWHTDERGTLQPGRIASVTAWPELSAMLRGSGFEFEWVDDSKPKPRKASRGRKVPEPIETQYSVQQIRHATAKGIRDLAAESLRIVADLVDDAANAPTNAPQRQRKTASGKLGKPHPTGSKRRGRKPAERTDAQRKIEGLLSQGMDLNQIDLQMIRDREEVIFGKETRKWKKLDARKTVNADRAIAVRKAQAKAAKKGTKTKRTK